MRVDVLKRDRLRNARSVAVLVLAGLVAGCSSDVARFDDGFYTGAVPRQPTPRMAMAQPAQAYPGNLDQTATGSIARAPTGVYGNNPGAGTQYGGNVGSPVTRTAPVERSMLAPPAGAPAPQPAYQPAPVAQAPAPMPAAPAAATQQASSRPAGKPGWQNTGNMVTLRQGETIDALSNRYGVPAKAILAANGLPAGSKGEAGQQISIPTYSYGQSPSATQTAAAPAQTLGTPPGPLRVPTAAPAAGRPAAGGGSIVVASGDSLNGIARRTGVSAADLRAANGITGDNIRIGQTLTLPSGAKAPTTRTAAVDTTTTGSLAAKPIAAAQPKPYEAPRAPSATPAAAEPAKVAAVAAAPAAADPAPVVAAAPKSSVSAATANDVATAAPEASGISQFRWPVQGRVVKRFGEKAGSRRNDGVDIAVPAGTPVKAAENGVVIYAGDGLKEFGNTVLVKHDNGLVTVYGHADQLKVKRGATVRRGQEIATAGTSGDTDAPKVHFEVRKDSAPVDPMTFLQ